jgi:hypothetical protein
MLLMPSVVVVPRRRRRDSRPAAADVRVGVAVLQRADRDGAQQKEDYAREGEVDDRAIGGPRREDAADAHTPTMSAPLFSTRSCSGRMNTA